MNSLGYFGIPTPLKKFEKSRKEWEHWPKPITPQLPPVGNKPSIV